MALARLLEPTRSLAAIAAIAAGLALPASGQIDPSIVPSLDEDVAWPQPSNAAPVYWRAFYFYSTREDLKGIDWSEMLATDDESGYALSPEQLEKVELTDDILAAALRASRVESCTWEIDYDQGIAALLPHLGPMRNMARLTAAHIRRCVMEGDIDGAVERLEAMHGYSRHCRSDGLLISSLVSCAIASLTAKETTLLLAEADLTPDQRARLITALDAYGEEDPFAIKHAVGNEGVWMTAWVAQEVRAGRLRQQMNFLFSLGDGSDTALIQSVQRMSDDALIEDLRRCREYYTDAVAIWDDREAADRLTAMGELVEAGRYGNMARLLAAALTKSHQADDRGRRTLADSREEILADQLAPQD